MASLAPLNASVRDNVGGMVMRWRLASLWVCAPVIAGCNKDINEPADSGSFRIKSSGQGITIVDVARDRVNREITARVVGDGMDGRF
jgi:hypothetical protein